MSLVAVALSLKGGPGSGNFGHAGIPGKVGGSAPTSSFPIVNTIDELTTAAFGRAFIITPDGGLIDVVSKDNPTLDHNDFVKNNSKYLGLDEQITDDNLDAAWGKLFRQGYIKVRDLKDEVDVRTDRLDATTLRQLQRLYDRNKLSMDPGQKLYWEGKDTYTTANYEDFLSAKHVVKGYRSELKSMSFKALLIALKAWPTREERLRKGLNVAQTAIKKPADSKLSEVEIVKPEDETEMDRLKRNQRARALKLAVAQRARRRKLSLAQQARSDVPEAKL